MIQPLATYAFQSLGYVSKLLYIKTHKKSNNLTLKFPLLQIYSFSVSLCMYVVAFI